MGLRKLILHCFYNPRRYTPFDHPYWLILEGLLASAGIAGWASDQPLASVTACIGLVATVSGHWLLRHLIFPDAEMGDLPPSDAESDGAETRSTP